MLTRPYDVAFSLKVREAVRRRRLHPTGEFHQVEQRLRGNQIVSVYPWKKLELGDFFFAPVTSANRRSVLVTLHQAAARHDMEIIVAPVVDARGQPCLRATLTFFGIRAVKMKARTYHGIKIQISDGRWTRRVKKWRRTKG